MFCVMAKVSPHRFRSCLSWPCERRLTESCFISRDFCVSCGSCVAILLIVDNGPFFARKIVSTFCTAFWDCLQVYMACLE